MRIGFKFISSIFIFLFLWGGFLHATSLWLKSGQPERSMFSDKKAMGVGDIVTIVISESTSLDNSVSLQTSRESSISNDFQQLLTSDLLRHNGESLSTDISVGANTHDGGGTISNSNSVSARISVQVIDVLPNGNLVLEGVRKIAYSNELYYVVTQGICRPDDISSENTISSSLIADARIEFISEGTLTESQRKGWFVRFMDKVSP